jgi:hypothetical protein
MGVPAGTGFTETAVISPARVTAVGAFGAASLGKITSTSSLTYNAATGAETIIGWALFDALTGGNMISADFIGATDPAPYTAVVSGNLFTAKAHAMVNTDRVVLLNDQYGTLPGGISATTLYYVISAATDTFQVSLTSGGAAVTLSSSGSGLFRKVREVIIGATDVMTFPIGTLSYEER